MGRPPPEQLGEVAAVPLHVEGAGREDDEPADDGKAGDGEHQTGGGELD